MSLIDFLLVIVHALKRTASLQINSLQLMFSLYPAFIAHALPMCTQVP